jgi:hypothetical protein
MGLFNFSKKSYTPTDNFLHHYLSGMYFYRIMPFRLEGQKIIAFDNNSPRVITFDPWPEGIFINANGNITMMQFLIETANGYNGNVPPSLEKTILEETEKLISKGFIATSEKPVELENDLRYPIKKELP